MYQNKKVWLGVSGEENVYIYPKMANRHGMIAGATGTGKTVTLKVLAESFSACGVPVFLADVIENIKRNTRWTPPYLAVASISLMRFS